MFLTFLLFDVFVYVQYRLFVYWLISFQTMYFGFMKCSESKQPILPTVPSMDTGPHGKAVCGNGGRHRSTIQEDGGTEEILLSKNKRKSKKLTSPKGEGHGKRRGSTMRSGSDKRSGSAKLEKNDGEVEKTEDGMFHGMFVNIVGM